MTDLQTEFPIQVDVEAGHPEAIKWTIEKEKYEIHQTILEKVEIGEILTHCLRVVHKIKTEVGYNEKKLVKSHIQVLPRTFSIPLTAMWDQIAEEFLMNEEKLANFNILLRHFFEAHSTDDDRHDLLTQIRNVRLPKQMKTQSFFYRLRELNDYVDWLPGHEPKLTEDQLNLAFYTGMRLKWKERYVNAGKSIQHNNRQSLLRYFRNQQVAAERNQILNTKLECPMRNLSQVIMHDKHYVGFTNYMSCRKPHDYLMTRSAQFI
jgi:hypothetical protein